MSGADVHLSTCCAKWNRQSVERRRSWAWQVLHVWALHSSVPFTAQRLADEGRVSLKVAEEMIAEALDLKWLLHAQRRAGGDLYGRWVKPK